MKHYQYLIIGGGLTGDAAVKGIRELDEQGSIGMFSMESDPPYSRPSLSKGLWKGKPVEKIWKNTKDLDVDIYLNKKITSLHVDRKTVVDENGEEYSYDKLLLATGCSPIQLPFGSDGIIYFRDFQDYQNLRELSEKKEKFLIIGGGFIGSEIAAALTMVGKKVTMVFLEEAIGSMIYPVELSNYLNDYYRQKGVEVLPNDSVESIEQNDNRFTVHTQSGGVYHVDGVVAGIGVKPNVELAKQAGIKLDNGILVDEQLRTSSQDIFSAGDVANFYHSLLKKRVRVEHEDNAIQMGKQAGRNMAGANEPYNYVPIFYSDLFDLGYEAVGELDSKFETIADWKEPYQEGVVYYLDGDQPRGMLLWNVWDAVPAARSILEEVPDMKKSDLNLQLLLNRKEKLD